MTARPLLLYIPGLKPKPPPDTHRAQLQRCLLAGLERSDREVAAGIAAQRRAFELASWTYEFYGEHRDIARDLAAIDAMLRKPAADARDIAQATAWPRRLLRTIYRVGDRLPFLIPKIANENMELQLRDIRRYVHDVNDVAEIARRHLKVRLRAAAGAARPVLLLAHSMGSMIAWDALWQLSRDASYQGKIDLMTLGSPLGLNYIQRRLLGADGEGAGRYPRVIRRCTACASASSPSGLNYIQRRLLGADGEGAGRYPRVIRRWVNLVAAGELTALDPELANDFAGMRELGLVDSIEDVEVYNWFRYGDRLNVHAEYGYLANAEVASRVAAWWREVGASSGNGIPPRIR